MPHKSTSPSVTGESAARAYLMLVAATMCWGGNAVLGKMAVGEIPPMLLVSSRWFGVVVLMLVFASSYVRRDWPVLRGRLMYVIFLGITGYAGFNILFYTAAYSTTALNIGIIQGGIPVFVLLGTFLVYRTRITALQYVGVTLTVSGVIFVGSHGNLAQLANLVFNVGDLLMVVACALYASYTVGLRRRPETSALGLFTLLAGVAFLASVPFSIVEYANDDFYWPSTLGWTIAAIVTVFPSFLAQLFFMQSVSRIGPNRAGIFINLVPVFSALFAVVILGEAIEMYHLIALGLVLGGIWLSERGKPST